MGNFLSRPAAKVGVAAFIIAYLYLQYSKKNKPSLKDKSPHKSSPTRPTRDSKTTTPSTTTTTPTPPPTPPTPAPTPAEIEIKFEEAQQRWKSFAHLANEDDKKQLYGLYKFILEGAPTSDSAPPPGSTDRPRIWKWEAWSEVTCETTQAAQLKYANLVFGIGARGGLVVQSPSSSGTSLVDSTTAATKEVNNAPSLLERFNNAEQYIKQEGNALGLGSTDLLELYGLFKQVKKGRCDQPEPSLWGGMEKKAKWNAWIQLGAMGPEEAMLAYVNKVTSVAGASWEGKDGTATATPVVRKKAPMGMGLNVSTIAEGQQPNDGTTTQDWKSLEGLHAAAKEGNTETTRTLLSNASMNIDAQNEEGMTALHWACESGHGGIVQLLLEKKANLTLRENMDGMTALHFAIPHAKVAELLVLAGADVNAQDNEGVTCLAMCDDTDQGPDRILRTKVDSLLASM